MKAGYSEPYRGRLIQPFLAESFSLSLAGGILGILMAAGAVRALPAILPANLPSQQGVAINTPVLLFGLAAIVAVARFRLGSSALGAPLEEISRKR